VVDRAAYEDVPPAEMGKRAAEAMKQMAQMHKK
jgi:hypothetical protein